MSKQVLILIAFGVMVILQLWLPAQTAIQYEKTLRQGEAFRFETVLVDPNDPFRGKFVTLDFTNFDADIKNTAQQEILKGLTAGQKVYCLLGTDDRGFAQVRELSLAPPDDNSYYFSAKVDYIFEREEGIEDVRLIYPFERFYMEESKAPAAERRYNEAIRDNEQEAYALVKIRKGMVVLEDVVVNGISITKVKREE